MIRERIADDTYIFTSRRYASVTCGAVVTKEGVILIDTLYFPDEAREVKEFIENRISQPVKYVINTHYHADHVTGTYLYPQATIVSHALCRELIDTVGRAGLEKTKSMSNEFADAKTVLPTLIVKEGTLDLTVGEKTVRLLHTPGHSEDLMGVYVLNDNIFFAADTMMPVPTFFDGDYDDLRASLKLIASIAPETVVQGHGEVILRGEVQNVIHNDLDYLSKIKEEVENVIEDGLPASSLDQISIESVGKSRIPLNGLVTDLHYANLHKLYTKMMDGKEPVEPMLR